MYEKLFEELASQHYRNEGVAPEDMTKAQRQAYEFFSGEQRLYVQYADDTVGMVAVNTCGDRIAPEGLEWLRENGAKLLRNVKQGKEEFNQLETLEVPDDLVVDSGEVADPWKNTIKQNLERADMMFDAMVQGVADESRPEQERGFALQMAFAQLIKEETHIIRAEHGAATGSPDVYYDETYRTRYAAKRVKLKELCGDKFAECYEQSRKSHNSCARTNLDNSDGHMFSYVLPEFHDDGSYEPWGERDVPWNARRGDAAA